MLISRPQIETLVSRLTEPRRFIQVVAGPRQTGKTTLVQQAVERLSQPVRYASADEPTLRGSEWVAQQWEAARLALREHASAVLVLDEVQKIPGWSETVKRLWDEDTRAGRSLHVVLLGSAPLLVAQGLTESLAGRFELIPVGHWSFDEMRAAFGLSVEAFIFYGGYPGAAPLIGEPERWRRYVLDSLIETTIARDVLLMSRIDKPALLRRLFELACRYSGQVLSYTKMLGQLQDAGNTVTLAHYLELLAGAGLVRGLPKYAGDAARSRASSPKLQVMNTALMSALTGLPFEQARADPEVWGRLVESAVGAHLANAEHQGDCTLYYWRERNHEVDFVVRSGARVVAIEVKSGRAPTAHRGSAAFARAFKPDRLLLVGGDGIAIEDFLGRPVTHWLAP
ncbi:MAG: ATP-binding protein [Casimicrobiaceae bacterium]|nr:ATP-binding protein [Casimicrobiaceae bacterium]